MSHWKIARDPYLAAVAERWGDQTADEAGFFLDGDPDDAPLDDVHWLCTPTEQVRQALTRPPTGAGPPVVLLGTGGFFPVHAGHLAMMDHARDAAESAGWWVVGGYLSPGHDQYLRRKWDDLAAPASLRLRSLAAATHATGWLSIDPWEALGRRGAVNYTDVVARLQAYLRAHLHPELVVAFVCGSDNARFALAFALQGRAIVVDRPGAEAERDRMRRDPRVAAAAERVLWAGRGIDAASSSLDPPPAERGRHRLTLRLEDATVVGSLALAPERWRTFQAALCDELRRSVALTTVTIAAQRRAAPTDGAADDVLSLDPMLPGPANLAVSRCFELGGYHQLGHVARPGHPPIADQLASLPSRSWRVRDDDCSTGGTIAFVRSLVPVDEVVTLLPADGGEIADSRDLLLGTDEGGLVVALPDGRLGRSPYLLPFVDPAGRGTVPAASSSTFSAAVWALNAAVFEGTGLAVENLPPPARATMRAAGHGPDESLVSVCRSYATTLSRLAGDRDAAPTRPAAAPGPAED